MLVDATPRSPPPRQPSRSQGRCDCNRTRDGFCRGLETHDVSLPTVVPSYHSEILMLTAIESILIFPSRLVRNLQPCAAQVGIFEEVYIGALVEPVMRRVICWRAVEVVDITKAMKRIDQSECAQELSPYGINRRQTYNVPTFSSPSRAAIFCDQQTRLSEQTQQHNNGRKD